jgi:RimJ/RimL family protein N-acetyltransferase
MIHNLWQGERVRLRGIEPEDWEQLHRWDADTNAQRTGHRVMPPRSRDATRQWAREQAQPDQDADDLRLAIESGDGKLAGALSTQQCDRRNGTFNLGIALGREYWGKGFATEAIQLLLRYYFDELGYQKANARVYAFNDRSRQLFERLGFEHEGTIRSQVYGAGGHHDELWFGILADEFREKHPAFAMKLDEAWRE